MKTLTIVLIDGPYITQYADMACKIARAGLKVCHVNIFLYLDAVNIPRKGQSPAFFANIGSMFGEIAASGATITACPRCARARGYIPDEGGECRDYLPGIKITSLYDLERMITSSDKVILLGE